MEDLPESPEECQQALRKTYRLVLDARHAVQQALGSFQRVDAKGDLEGNHPDLHGYIISLGRLERARADCEHAERAYSNLLQRYAARWGEGEGGAT